MTIAFSRQTMGTLPFEGALPGEQWPAGFMPERPAEAEMPQPAAAPGPPPSDDNRERSRATVMPLGLRLLRRVLRPLAWHMRGFMLHEITLRLADVQRGQTAMAQSMTALERQAERPIAAATTRVTLRRKVHQFHAGSATGDAITNAMLLLQARLRGLGYDSEIYAEHVGCGLEDRLLPLAALPQGSDFVLLVHHSMGHGAFARLLASPARKILIYHNITPPGLLAHNRHLRDAAVLGRTQLTLWRDHVAAAIADSAFNGVELRRLGYPCVLEAALLFDVATMGGTSARQTTAPYTVLFVGRLAPSKGQAALIEAFAVFARRLRESNGRPARLVLVGAEQSDAMAYRHDLDRQAAGCGYGAEVLITGKISDAALQGWYRQADLYVSLSRHEGFGVPLVEAMAYGLPVLALRAGAVAETLGPHARLLDAASSGDAVADAMLRMALDTADTAHLVACQTASLRRWDLPQHLAVLQQALGLAGIAPPMSTETRRIIRGNVQLDVVADSSLARLSAALLRWRPEAVASDIGEAVELLVRVSDRPDDGQRPAPLLVLQDCNTTRIGIEQVRALNRGADGVLVPTRFVAGALLGSGVHVPIHIVGHGHDLGRFAALRRGHPPSPGGALRFLHVAEDTGRAGTELLLAAWVLAFCAADLVRLVVLAAPHAASATRLLMDRLLRQNSGHAAIIVEIADLTIDALAVAYAGTDVVVLPSRADGQGLFADAALAAGCHLILTGTGGAMDAPEITRARRLRYQWQQARSDGAAHALWAEPEQRDLVDALRAARRPRPQPDLVQADGSRDWVARVAEAAADILLRPPPEQSSLAVVSPWYAGTAHAGHSRQLLAEFQTRPVIFCEPGKPGDLAEPAPALRRHSLLGQGAALACGIGAEDADIVLIRHAPGSLPWPDLAALLNAPAIRRRCVVVMLAEAAALASLPPPLREMLCAALGQVARVVVGEVGALGVLRGLGLGKAEFLPDGITSGPRQSMPTLLYASDAPVIGCTGALLPEHGLQRLLRAAALLRRSWPHLRLRLVMALLPDAASVREHHACLALAEGLGLDGQIEWQTGALSAESARALLGGCDLVVLPSAPGARAAIEAARLALGSRAPVVVTDLPMFDECGNAVERLSCTAPQDMANRMAVLLRQPEQRAALQERATVWLQAHDWRLIAERLEGMLTGLWRARLDAARAITDIAASGSDGGCVGQQRTDTDMAATGLERRYG